MKLAMINNSAGEMECSICGLLLFFCFFPFLLPQRLTEREKLPITSMAGDIVKAVRKNKVIVVKGNTGCGKTTQVCDLSVTLTLLSG